jgi:hypothetical protein
MIYRRRVKLPDELGADAKAIFTVAEIAEILGWTLGYTRKFVALKKLPCVKIGGGRRGGIKLYSAKTVRELAWRRSGRSVSAQRAPFLIPELVELFLKSQSELDAIIPADGEFSDDDLLAKKMRRLSKARIDKREAMLADFMERYRDVAALVETVRNLDSKGG